MPTETPQATSVAHGAEVRRPASDPRRAAGRRARPVSSAALAIRWPADRHRIDRVRRLDVGGVPAAAAAGGARAARRPPRRRTRRSSRGHDIATHSPQPSAPASVTHPHQQDVAVHLECRTTSGTGGPAGAGRGTGRRRRSSRRRSQHVVAVVADPDDRPAGREGGAEHGSRRPAASAGPGRRRARG